MSIEGPAKVYVAHFFFPYHLNYMHMKIRIYSKCLLKYLALLSAPSVATANLVQTLGEIVIKGSFLSRSLAAH